MNALVLGLGSMLLGCALHALALRWMSWRSCMLALPALVLVSFASLVVFAPLPGGVAATEDILVGLILSLSLGFVYALTLIGVLYDSPTLALVNTITGHGAAGMPLDGFEAFVAAHPFLRSRLNALIAAGEIGEMMASCG